MLDIHPAALESLISDIAHSLTKLLINSCVLDANAVKQLADTDLPCLQSLSLGRGIVDRGMAKLMCGRWPNMTELVLHDSCLGGDALQPFSQAHWTQLHSLSLIHSGVDSAAMAYLVSARLPCLTSLSLSFNKLDRAAVEHLTNGHWTQLLSLDLVACNLGDETVNMLSHAPWPLLQQLQHNRLSHKAMSSLIQGSWPCLQQLDLSDTGVCMSAVSGLVSGPCPGLQELRVAQSTWDIFTWRATWGDWSLLHTLDLSHHNDLQFCYLTYGGMPRLQKLYLNCVRSRHAHSSLYNLSLGDWPQLNTLQLRGNHVGCTEHKGVVKGKWPLLQHLDLSDNMLHDTALNDLAGAGWPFLQSLDLSRNCFDAAALTAFCNSKHFCLLGGGQWPHLSAFDASNQRNRRDKKRKVICVCM